MEVFHERRNGDSEILAEVRVLESKFDRHMEIYRENGIESKRVADALVELQHGIARMLENSGSCESKVALMYTQFLEDVAVERVDAKRMKKVIQWGATIAAAGVIIGFVKLVLLS